MKTIDIKVELYLFTELSHEAQQAALEDHEAFLEFAKKIWGLTDQEIREAIIEGNYYFFISGELASTTHYPNKTIFAFENKEYEI